jgi:hypothetical protein
MTVQLVRYESMRKAVAQCATIDAAAEIKETAAALEAYARQHHDKQLAAWTAEIKLRASIRIGELVQRLATAKTGGPKVRSYNTSRIAAAARAAFPRRTAYQYEQLAGSKDARSRAAGKDAAEHYFAKAKAEGKRPKLKELRAAMRGAVEPIPESQIIRRTKSSIDWTVAVKSLSSVPADFPSVALAKDTPSLRDELLKEAKTAVALLQRWIDELEKVNANAP